MPHRIVYDGLPSLKDPAARWSIGPFTMAAKFHYAWMIVIMLSFVQMAAGSVRNIFGVMVDPLVEEFGWRQGDLSGAYALSQITGALLAPVAGLMADRFGERKTMLVGIACFGGGMALTGTTSQLWHLYVSFGILMGASLATFQIVLITSAMGWFRLRLGLAIGILMGLNGVGPAVAAPVLSILLDSVSWQAAFWIIGFTGSGLMLTVLLFFRNRPADMGLRPYGATAADDDAMGIAAIDPETAKLRSKLFRDQVQKTSAFWNLIAIHFLGCVGHVIILIYIIPMAIDVGVSRTAAAGIITIVSVVSIFSRIGAPVIAERLGGKPSMAVCFFLQGVTVIALFWVQDLWAFYLFAAAFAIGLGGEMSVFPIINRQYFGVAPLGNVYGWQILGGGAGMALGGWLGGVIFDLTDAYDVAIVLSMITSLSGFLLIIFLEPTNRLLVKPWHEWASPPAVPEIGLASPVAGAGHAD